MEVKHILSYYLNIVRNFIPSSRLTAWCFAYVIIWEYMLLLRKPHRHIISVSANKIHCWTRLLSLFLILLSIVETSPLTGLSSRILWLWLSGTRFGFSLRYMSIHSNILVLLWKYWSTVHCDICLSSFMEISHSRANLFIIFIMIIV